MFAGVPYGYPPSQFHNLKGYKQSPVRPQPTRPLITPTAMIHFRLRQLLLLLAIPFAFSLARPVPDDPETKSEAMKNGVVGPDWKRDMANVVSRNGIDQRSE